MLVKDWPGTHHVDIGGNVKFLTEGGAEEIRCRIESLLDDPAEFQRMASVAREKRMQVFSYRETAKRSIELNDDGQ